MGRGWLGRLTVRGVVIGLAGCTSALQVEPPPAAGEACVTMAELEPFVADSEDPVQQFLRLSNPCDGAAQILGFDLADSQNLFSVGVPESDVLGPGEEATVTIGFWPQRRGSYEAFLNVRTSSGPTNELLLSAQTLGPELATTPPSVDAGAVPLGCPTQVELSLDNVGERVGTVVDLNVANTDGWSLVPTESTPFDVAVDRGQRLVVQVEPMIEGELRSDLTIVSSDSRLPDVVVPLRATGVATPIVEQVWGGVRQRDVLFAVDRSCSLDDVHDDLIDAIPSFVSQARRNSVDLHLGVVVGDHGCIVGETTFIDESFSASDARSVMATMVDSARRLAPYGSNEERPLMQFEAALSADHIGPDGCNADWFRESASLQLVSVSDEADSFSSSWTYYRDVFAGVKATGAGFQHHLIGSPSGGGCAGFPVSDGLSRLTVETGGVEAEICGPMATALSDIADVALDVSRADSERLVLDEPAIPSTVAVWVDDEPVLGWAFDVAANAVVFDAGAVPSALAVVRVQYSPFADCD